jgi:hypothetical protein
MDLKAFIPGIKFGGNPRICFVKTMFNTGLTPREAV